MAEPLLDIAEVAERSGLAPSALRFYEKRGLVASSGRNGLRRTYRPDVLDRLALIACARGAGFTIAEIARFLVATPDDTGLRARMAEKARELEEDIARLTRMRDGLHHASTCMHEPLVACPDFKRTFKGPVPPVTGRARPDGRRLAGVAASAGRARTGAGE
ncbi:MerR family transcriptional regulator [Streptosporangium longisporum]|uniref:Helix-turn-helix domain-containing protein n=1 Tax=Streptosporangium longisporum TaxID=46187 RepID=A0ABP6KT49_9ACTN